MGGKIRPLFTLSFAQRLGVLRHIRGVRTDTRFDACANYTMYGGRLFKLEHREFGKDRNALGVINRNGAKGARMPKRVSPLIHSEWT